MAEQATRKAVGTTGHVVDLWIEHHGTICLVRPYTPVGEEWCGDYLTEAQCLGKARAVEPRYLDDIVNGALNDGLRVGGS